MIDGPRRFPEDSGTYLDVAAEFMIDDTERVADTLISKASDGTLLYRSGNSYLTQDDHITFLRNSFSLRNGRGRSTVCKITDQINVFGLEGVGAEHSRIFIERRSRLKRARGEARRQLLTDSWSLDLFLGAVGTPDVTIEYDAQFDLATTRFKVEERGMDQPALYSPHQILYGNEIEDEQGEGFSERLADAFHTMYLVGLATQGLGNALRTRSLSHVSGGLVPMPDPHARPENLITKAIDRTALIGTSRL